MNPYRSGRRGPVGRRVARWALLFSVAVGVPWAGAQTAPPSVAEVNGEVITAKDLEEAAGMKYAQLAEQMYELKRQQLDAIIAQKLLTQEAGRRGLAVGQLLDAEVTSKVTLVSEQEVEAFYEQNKARLPSNEPGIRERIRAYLQQQKLTTRRTEFIDSLKAKSNVVVRLDPPPVVRLPVSTAGAPARGPAEARVTIVEFSDFQCPYCKMAQPTLKQILDRYQGKVKLVYRDYPLDNSHPLARKAAEAARCANDQGKFWEYHDVLFSNSPQLQPDDLRRYAEQVALDKAKFDGCLSSGVHQAAVQRDFEDGARLGINGTPAFFINGRPITGAQPPEAFSRLIEEELSRL